MLGDVAVDHVGDAWGTAPLVARRQRILPLVDGAAQFLGAFAGCRHTPLRPAPDGHPPLPPGVPVVDGEGPRARGLYTGGEADHLRVENLIADAGLRLCLAQGFLIEFQSFDHPFRLLARRHRRRPAPLSSRSTGQRPEYRRKVELERDGTFRSPERWGRQRSFVLNREAELVAYGHHQTLDVPGWSEPRFPYDNRIDRATLIKPSSDCSPRGERIKRRPYVPVN